MFQEQDGWQLDFLLEPKVISELVKIRIVYFLLFGNGIKVPISGLKRQISRGGQELVLLVFPSATKDILERGKGQIHSGILFFLMTFANGIRLPIHGAK